MSHASPTLQRRSQHTPLMQNADPHTPTVEALQGSPSCFGVRVGVRVCVGVGVRVGVRVRVGVKVNVRVGRGVGGVTPQPYKALSTAARISLTVMSPSRFTSPAWQPETGAAPILMLTMVNRSLTVTAFPPRQVPTQGVGVRVGVL